MKVPAPNEALYAHANWVEERMMQQDCPPRGTAEYLRRIAAMAEVLEKRPPIICLIGSTRYHEYFAQYTFHFTLKGAIVLTIGRMDKRDEDLHMNEEIKNRLDVLHMWKIIMADRVFCLNVDQYIGKSTARELGFATLLGKPIEYVEPVIGDVFMDFTVMDEMVDVIALASAVGVPVRG